MNEYRIESTDETVPLRGDPTESPWTKANSIRIDEHPWYGEAPAERNVPIEARAQLLYDERALYIQYEVIDGHQQATTTELNGRVWTDSCVELFANPVPDRGHYFNFEANCTGHFRLGFGPGREDRRLVPPELADAVHVETSVSGPRKEPEPGTDERWWLAAALPFDALRAFTDLNFDHSSGAVWRGNLQCCREDSAPSYAIWSSIDVPSPDFHRPDQFGRLVFR